MKKNIYGILPMAGTGSRIQPLGFSKELYPIIYHGKHWAISEFSVLAMANAGVSRIIMVVHPLKQDIERYYRSRYALHIDYHTYPSPSLPDSCFCYIDSLKDDDYCVFGLPDTFFCPNSSYIKLIDQVVRGSDISLGLFKVPDGSKFDSVAFTPDYRVTGVSVKKNPPLSNWIWGIWGAKVKTVKLLRNYMSQQQSGTDRLLGVCFDRLAKERKDISFTCIKLGQRYFDFASMDVIGGVNAIANTWRVFDFPHMYIK